jgi:hypothetical protein
MNGGGSDQARPSIKKAYRAMKTISSTIVRIAVCRDLVSPQDAYPYYYYYYYYYYCR